jgi:hypothetical protein
VNTFFEFCQRIAASLTLALSVPALVLAPAPASAAVTHTDRTVVYSTSLQPINQNIAYPVTGTLHIKTSSDGIVTGFYRTDDNISQFIPVSGGITGSNVFLLIGANHPTRINGTVENGQIVGTAYTASNGVYKFAATNATLQ